MSDHPLDVLLVEPFPSKRWISIIRYCDAISERAPFEGIELRTAIAPWWNPPSLLEGVRRRWWRQSGLTASHDVVHLSDQALGHHVRRFAPTPTVVTCHDVMPFVVENFFRQRRMGTVKRNLLRHSIAGMLSANRIIAVSERTANDLARRFGYPARRISVVPNMVADGFEPGAGAPQALAAAATQLPPNPRILSVGHCGGYKNLETLIDALAQPSLREASLIRVGFPLTERQRARTETRGVARRVVELGRISNTELIDVYRACDVLAQPSIYEGFGVPVIEAMACGLPVVCSDGGALPEVAGEAALVVPAARRDTRAVEALAEGLSCVLRDAALRSELRHRGLARSQRYRPAAVLPQLASTYRSAAGAAG